MRTIVAVPARLASSRLPGKILADIAGKPMLQWVLEACLQARSPQAVVLCTDAPELIEVASRWGCQALLTSPACSSGSELRRLARLRTSVGSQRTPSHRKRGGPLVACPRISGFTRSCSFKSPNAGGQ